MPYYFMRDTPLQALEQLMMSQPGQKPRGGGIYRSPFHYTPKDVACEYCQNYDRKHPCRLCECTCLEERIEAGVLEMNEFVRDCFAPSNKTIVNPDGDDSNRGQNAFFYDAAEGLLTSAILMLAEFLPPDKEHPQERRHIVSVFKLVQDLLEPSKVKGKSHFQLLMGKLPPDHLRRTRA